MRCSFPLNRAPFLRVDARLRASPAPNYRKFSAPHNTGTSPELARCTNTQRFEQRGGRLSLRCIVLSTQRRRRRRERGSARAIRYDFVSDDGPLMGRLGERVSPGFSGVCIAPGPCRRMPDAVLELVDERSKGQHYGGCTSGTRLEQKHGTIGGCTRNPTHHPPPSHPHALGSPSSPAASLWSIWWLWVFWALGWSWARGAGLSRRSALLID